MDIIGYISDNVSLSAAKKTAMLLDFVKQYGYEETVPDPENEGQEIPNPVSKKSFANEKIERFVIETVHAARKKAAESVVEYEELLLE